MSVFDIISNIVLCQSHLL